MLLHLTINAGTCCGLHKAKKALMSVSYWKPFFPNDQKPEVSFWPAGRCQYHEEALNVVDAGWVIHIDPRAIQKVDSALLNQPCVSKCMHVA